MDDVEILRKWAKEYNVLFRGPEIHIHRKKVNFLYIHIGPVDYIPVIGVK
ncbi:MAG: hypothetical protein KatS3mg107_1086 [Gemmataceae bacterium]|jgi:hypothetical protein|nr:MAG: hypothetical protein KatS3mg107_1086 [Gemmataceae bacterium]